MCGPDTKIRVSESIRGRERKCASPTNPWVLRRKDNRKQRTHGLTRAEARAVIAKAAGACQLCGQPGDLVVDHCHTTGKIRGALCHHCNTGLGMFKDDPARLMAAVRYLGRYG